MASDVPRQPVLPPVWQRQIAQMQASVRSGTFSLSSLPGYEPGVPPAVETWHDIDYLDIYPKIYGSEFGANGIGRLREVALTEITQNERFTPFDLDPAYFPKTALEYGALDIARMKDQSLEYEAQLEKQGVLVHRICYPDPPVGAFGPQRATWAANELLVLRGGSVIEKIAISPLGFGRCEYLAYWAFTSLGIPPILAITGRGVAEAGPCFWLAEDVFVAARGLAFNDEGLDQLLPTVRRSSRADEMHTVIIDCPGGEYFHAGSGVSHHPDMVLGPLDVRKVIAYVPGLDYRSWRWLKENGYEIVEVERDEQVCFAPANVTIIEPGLVVMHAEAVGAVAAVRKSGVEVIEVPYSEFLRSGGGLHCSTMRIRRDPGPFSTDQRVS